MDSEGRPPAGDGPSAPAAGTRLLAVTGMSGEARIAARAGWAAVCSGGSPERLRGLLAGQPQGAFGAVLSFGVAGGLDPSLRPGTIVVATSIVAGRQRSSTNISLTARVAGLLSGAGREPILGPVTGVDVAVLDPEEKRALILSTGAVAVDLESHVAAEFAEGVGLPFAALRVVIDPAERALPPVLAGALRPDGSTDIGLVLRATLRQPMLTGDLWRLARDARLAFGALRRVGLALGGSELLGAGLLGADL